MSTNYSLTATVSATRPGAAVEILNTGLCASGDSKRVGSVEEYIAYEAQVSGMSRDEIRHQMETVSMIEPGTFNEETKEHKAMRTKLEEYDRLKTIHVVRDNKRCPNMRMSHITPRKSGFSFDLNGNVNAIYLFLELMLAEYPDIEITTVGGDDEGYSTEHGTTTTKRVIETISQENVPTVRNQQSEPF